MLDLDFFTWIPFTKSNWRWTFT